MSKEVLILFLWSRQDKWSSKIADTVQDITVPNLVLRSISADSLEVRNMLNNHVPRIERIPAVISVSKASGKKDLAVVYEEAEIEALLSSLGALAESV